MRPTKFPSVSRVLALVLRKADLSPIRAAEKSSSATNRSNLRIPSQLPSRLQQKQESWDLAIVPLG